MKLFVTLVNGFHLLINVTNSSALDVAVVVDMPLNYIHIYRFKEKFLQEKCPPGKIPSRKLPTGKLHPPNPLKKGYFVKLPHVMEYLNGENFINFKFRQP